MGILEILFAGLVLDRVGQFGKLSFDRHNRLGTLDRVELLKGLVALLGLVLAQVAAHGITPRPGPVAGTITKALAPVVTPIIGTTLIEATTEDVTVDLDDSFVHLGANEGIITGTVTSLVLRSVLGTSDDAKLLVRGSKGAGEESEGGSNKEFHDKLKVKTISVRARSKQKHAEGEIVGYCLDVPFSICSRFEIVRREEIVFEKAKAKLALCLLAYNQVQFVQRVYDHTEKRPCRKRYKTYIVVVVVQSKVIGPIRNAVPCCGLLVYP